MGAGLNCEFFEVADVGYFYVMEHGSAPKDTWDWHDYADSYGPFPTKELAEEHQIGNHRNPGGAEITGPIDPTKEPYRRLIAEATSPAVQLPLRWW